MLKRGTSSAYLEDPTSLEVKRQRQSTERHARYLRREKRMAIAQMRQKRRVRLAVEGYVDVFKLLPRVDLSTLEISHRKFHSIVNTQLNSVCLIAVDVAEVNNFMGLIVLDGEAKFGAIDESHRGPAPHAQKHLHENVYVLLQRVASKCRIKKLIMNQARGLDDVACKALIATQQNVGEAAFIVANFTASTAALDVVHSALFGFSSVSFTALTASYEVFAAHAIQRSQDCKLGKIWLDAPKDQARFHDDDLVSLFSAMGRNTEPMIFFEGLRLSSEFFLKVVEAHTSNVLSDNFSCNISDSEVEEQNRGTHNFIQVSRPYEHYAKFVLEQQNLPHLHFKTDLCRGGITFFRRSD